MIDPQDLEVMYQHIFELDEGKTVLEDMQKRFHADRSTFSKDALEMAFLEGQRSVILFIENKLFATTENRKELEQDE